MWNKWIESYYEENVFMCIPYWLSFFYFRWNRQTQQPYRIDHSKQDLKFVWTTETKLMPIEFVRDKSFIWDKSDKFYINTQKKLAAFHEIAESLGTSGKFIAKH